MSRFSVQGAENLHEVTRKGRATVARSTTVILVCGALILSIAMGVRQSFGIFLEPIVLDLDLPRQTFALAIAVQNLLWGLTQPAAGMVADRFGTARVLSGGAAVYAVGLVVMGLSQSAGGLHLGAGLLVGLGMSATSFAVVLGAIGRFVPAERRSMALGMASAGGSLGQFLVVPLGQFLIEGVGWSISLILLAGLAAAIVPLAIPLAGRAGSSGLLEESQTLSEALMEATRHPGFWLLTTAFFVCGFHVAFVATHIAVFAVSCGLPAMTGATALSLIGLFNIAGTWLAGALGGRYRKRYLLAAIYFLRGVVIIVLLLVPKTSTNILIFSAVLGTLWLGTVPLTTGLVGEIFGPRYVATLFGIVFLGHQVGAFFGAWLGGLVFDATGSFDLMWFASIALALLAAVMHLPIRDRPVPRLSAAASG